MSPSPGGSRRRLAWAVIGVVAALAGATTMFVLNSEPGNVSNPDVEFEVAPPTAPPKSQPKRQRSVFDDGFEWPVYGFTKSRTRYLPVERPLRPPFVGRWRETGRILLEFPPVLCKRSLFLLKNNAALYAVSRRSGDVRWKRKLGYLAAASPACSHGRVFAVLLEHRRGSGAGRVVALRASNGRVLWSRRLPSRTESSPLLDHGTLYFGSENGTVYAMRASDGFVRWKYRAEGAVKGALALESGKLFFGDYAGHVTALRATDGRRLWKVGTSGGALGLGSGNFYATPAVAYGRVYIGNTDGFIYSFSTRNGDLAWRHKTGGYVYSSPAVSPVRGGTVFAGSYDGHLYALDARTGGLRWRRNAGGRISGGPVVVGDLVFYSNLARKATAAVGASNGRLMWSIGRGAFNPVISDGKRIYLVGYSSLFMLEPGRKKRRPRAERIPISRRRGHLRREHGHHHGGRGAPPRCHRHAHHRHENGSVIRYTHTHCHRHVPGVRR